MKPFDPGNVSLHSDRWRYLRYDAESAARYDLGLDPNERPNLAGDSKHNERLESFRHRIPAESLKYCDQFRNRFVNLDTRQVN